MKRIKIIPTVIMLLLTSSIYAQKNDGITFTVNATGVVNILADDINLTMNLGVENTDPQKAFDEHKLGEQKIIKLESAKEGKVVFDLEKIKKIKQFESNIDNFINSLDNIKLQSLDVRGKIEEIAKEAKVDREIVDEIIDRIGNYETQ